MNFRVRFGQTVLAKKKIAIFPGHFGGNRVGSLGSSEIAVRFAFVPGHFKRAREIELVIRGARIELYRAPVIGNGQRNVRVIKIELAVPSQSVPDLRVAGLNAGGAFPVLRIRGYYVMACQCVFGARIAEPHRGYNRNDSSSPPPGRVGSSFRHARIICYECLALRN